MTNLSRATLAVVFFALAFFLIIARGIFQHGVLVVWH